MHGNQDNKYNMADPALSAALNNLEVARNHFNNASRDILDAAIYELTAAELHLRATIIKARDAEFNAAAETPGDKPGLLCSLIHPSPQLKHMENDAP